MSQWGYIFHIISLKIYYGEEKYHRIKLLSEF
jgi:hypothetical protein